MRNNISGKNLALDNPNHTSEHFNNHFCNIAKKIEKEIPRSKKVFTDYLKKPLQNTFFINPTTPEDTESEIETLKNNKASGPSSIPTKIFKTFAKPLSKQLADLINLSFSTGKLPSSLKIAKVIPVFKNGDKLDCNNYRPISLISNISKIMEKLMHSRLYLYLERNNIFYNLQFGFRNGHSTTIALLEITEKIIEACDKEFFSCRVFLDFKKDVDTASHPILISKLEYYEVRGIANNWFQSFLTNRKQFRSANDFNST